MSRQLPDVLVRHPELPCRSHPAVRSALESGHFTFDTSEPFTTLGELLGTYKVREQHLARLPGSYAKQLRQSTISFCSALERQPPGCQVSARSVNLDNGLILAVWERADTRELLGCNVCYDHRMVTDSDWDRLWGPTT